MDLAFKCPTCQKDFYRKGDLTRHEKLHTGLRPHICLDCGKRFSQRCGLKTHYNIHLKVKPYKCGLDDCKSAFGDPSSCSRHRKEVHDAVKYNQCYVKGCSSRIKRYSAFLKHLREQHGETPERIVNRGKRSGKMPLISSKASKSTVKEQHSALFAPPVFASQQPPKQYANPAYEVNPQDWDSIISFDWPQEQGPPQPPCGSSSLLTGTDFGGHFVMPNNAFGQMYHIDSLSPCLTPPALSYSPSSSPESSESSYGASYLATPISHNVPYPQVISTTIDPTQLSSGSSLSTCLDLPPCPEAVFDSGYFVTLPRPNRLSAGGSGYESVALPPTAFTAKPLSPLLQFSFLPRLSHDASSGYEADADSFYDYLGGFWNVQSAS